MKNLKIISFALSLLAFTACKKSEKTVISQPQIQVGKAIPNTGTLPAGS